MNMKVFNGIWAIMKPYRIKLYAALVAVIIAGILTAAAPAIEGMITTQLSKDIIAAKSTVSSIQVNFSFIYKVLVGLLCVYLLNTLARLLLQWLLTEVIQSSIYDLRMSVKIKMGQLPVRYFDAHAAGDLMSRMTSDIEVLSGALQQGLAQVLLAILSLIFAIIMMFVIDTKMALIGITIIPITVFFSRLVIRKSQPLFERQQQALGVVFSVVQEKLTGYNEIKLYNYQEATIESFNAANNDLCEAGFKANFVSGLMNPGVTLITYIVIAVAVFLGAIKVAQGVMVVGALQAFVRYIWQVNQPLAQMTQLAPTLQSSMAAAKRVFDYLDEANDIVDVLDYREIESFSGAVSFNDISFGYGTKPIIKNVSVNIEAGEMVAIVGPTGAGKTTIINLLMRFYDVDAGSISIDGIDIRNMKRDDLRSLFGMVLQDTWLFKGTIKENIAYGKPNATDASVVDAAKRANVHHFITTLPNGYEMILNEESSNISNGEKQLLTIARALLCDPKIMILDEATSSVDTRLDAMIQEAMATLMKGRTSFVIAHRLSTIRNADKILVMRDGNIIEVGNHDALMQQKGFYADLYNSQFES
ncbi:ABC transporter ATP-binding protein [Erysipelothrix aquatica]|uniref:ABC transporter ATP-binding protein n=1 Tax=Erysipelothrix aquatica TaxID=2683714 RepID=UPI003AF32787